MNTNKTLLLLFVLLFSLNCKASKVTELVIISAMHGAHKNHPTYNYNVLYNLVDSFEPDYVGVEIRQEDITGNNNYLQKNYPKEMVELVKRHNAHVFGFDWLGESIEGIKIPENYWLNMKVKKLGKEMNRDSDFLNKKPIELKKQRELQTKIIEQATPYSINNGGYGEICRVIDDFYDLWFKDSKYIGIIQFDKQRDKEIGLNIIKFIEQHRGKRIVMVMGADHRTFAVENINKHFKGNVKILSII